MHQPEPEMITMPNKPLKDITPWLSGWCNFAGCQSGLLKLPTSKRNELFIEVRSLVPKRPCGNRELSNTTCYSACFVNLVRREAHVMMDDGSLTNIKLFQHTTEDGKHVPFRWDWFEKCKQNPSIRVYTRKDEIRGSCVVLETKEDDPIGFEDSDKKFTSVIWHILPNTIERFTSLQPRAYWTGGSGTSIVSRECRLPDEDGELVQLFALPEFTDE